MGRGAPGFAGARASRGPLRGGPLRGGPLRGGPLRGGPLRGGPLRGGPLRGGPLRGGPLRGGPLRGGPLRGGRFAGSRFAGDLMSGRIRVRSTEREQLVEITGEVRRWLRGNSEGEGVLHLWAMHTTCGLVVNEGADPDVARDIVTTLRRLVPRSGDYRHSEGNSDSHLKTLLSGPGETLLVERGDLVLGTWQKLFLAEWDGPRERTVALAFIPA